VLVHCMAGVSRSASFVIAYVMRKQGKGFEQALQFVKERRAKANPN
jgi:protein-tyrosine phosphatase